MSWPVPLSVLDLSPVPSGATTGEALRRSLDLARHVEAWGYRRFWVAEHHNMPGIASSAPAVLAGQVAAVTSTLRVGSGGVMLPNHAPLVVAEQFGMLEGLYPGRIDLGIGRAPGTDQVTALALRRRLEALSADEFPEQLSALLGFFEGDATEDGATGDGATGDGATEDGATGDGAHGGGGRDGAGYGISDRTGARRGPRRVRAIPAEGNEPAVWLLGSSGYSAQVAGLLGLPFAFAHHFAAVNTEPALELYRRCFRPSARLAEPYCLIGVAVVCAPEAEEASYLHGSSRLSMLRLRTGRPSTLPSPEEAAQYPYGEGDRELIARATGSHVVGDPAAVTDQLTHLVARTGVDELMITTNVYDHAARLRSFRLVAEAASEATKRALPR